MSKNDSKIMTLKAKIDEKRKLLSTTPKFIPETNCSIEIDGTRYNLHAASKSDLILLLCKLYSLNESAKALCCEDELVISGYTASIWIADIRSRLENIEYSNEMKKLQSLESRLDSMLSDDKKTELEIDSIEAMISG